MRTTILRGGVLLALATCSFAAKAHATRGERPGVARRVLGQVRKHAATSLVLGVPALVGGYLSYKYGVGPDTVMLAISGFPVLPLRVQQAAVRKAEGRYIEHTAPLRERVRSEVARFTAAAGPTPEAAPEAIARLKTTGLVDTLARSLTPLTGPRGVYLIAKLRRRNILVLTSDGEFMVATHTNAWAGAGAPVGLSHDGGVVMVVQGVKRVRDASEAELKSVSGADVVSGLVQVGKEVGARGPALVALGVRE